MLLLAEGFDALAPLEDGLPVPSGATITSEGRRGGGALRMTATNGFALVSLPRVVTATIVCGYAYKLSALPSALGNLFMPVNGTTQNLTVLVNTAGHIELRERNASTTIATSAAQVLFANEWTYLEHKFLAADAGSYELWANGVQVLSHTGDLQTTTASAGANDLRIYHPSVASNPVFVDDVYVLDSSGTVNNDRLGDSAIVLLNPSGNGATSGMTGSDGNSVDNYALVADADDATYVEGDVDDELDTYAFADLPFASGTVRAVDLYHRTRRTSLGYRAVRPVRRVGGVDTFDSQHVPSQSFGTRRTRMETRPDGSAWTVADVNGAEFGMQVRPFVPA